MDGPIFLALLQDGLTTGAIYVLLAIGLLIAFGVTRVIYIPQGDLVSLSALSLATLIGHHVPATLWLLDALCAVALVLSWRRPGFAAVLGYLVAPGLLTLACWWAVRASAPAPVQMLLTIGIITGLGPLLYRFAYETLAEASMLALLIVSMALHFVLVGAALAAFGAEEYATPALTDASFDLGAVQVSGQSLCVAAVCAVMAAGLRWFFARSLYGRALRAAASDRLGARLMGIDHALSGRAAFALAHATAAVGGILVGAITPLSFDTGFEIGLKGFVAAVMGGLASYPLAAAGGLLVGVLESFSGFWASEYRNVIVFALLIPVLLLLSRAGGAAEDRA
jgi:branched-chain amino acid transport system permease protein